MKLHRGRLLGIVMGLVILVAIFLLPFGSQSLYSSGSALISDLSDVQASGDTAAVAYSYVVVIAFILLVIAGLVGIFPLGTGVLGVVGMAMITVAPFLIYPSGGGDTLSNGTGFFVIWIASIVALAASFWHGKKQIATPAVNVTVQQ